MTANLDQPVMLGERVTRSDGTIATWEMLFPEGVFKHPKYGKLDYRKPYFDKLQTNFDTRVRGVDISMDIQHENGEAAGWIKELQQRPGAGLFGLVEWTDLGVDKVTKKLLRYVSPEIGPHTDEVTGVKTTDVLNAVALTNFPFLKRQDGITIALSECVELADPQPPCDACGKPEDECDCTELTDERGHVIRTPAAAADGSDAKGAAPGKGTKKVKANTSTEGAPIPGEMSGPKPSITRGRSPDPTSESSHMSDIDTKVTEGMVTLAEMNEQKELITRLSEKAAKVEAENVLLSARLAKSERITLTQEVDMAVTRLSEPRAAVGEVSARYGVPTSVTDMFKTFALSDAATPESRAAMLEILEKVRETGMAALSDRGVAGSGAKNDPEDKSTEGVRLDEKIANKAIALATADGKDFVTLSLADRELYGLRAEKAVSSR